MTDIGPDAIATRIAAVLAQSVRDTIQSVRDVPNVLRYWVREALDWLGVDDCGLLIDRQSAILTGVANALNGPPPPLVSWSHHDLAEKAAAVVAVAEAAREARDAERDTHYAKDALSQTIVALDRARAAERNLDAALDAWRAGGGA